MPQTPLCFLKDYTYATLPVTLIFVQLLFFFSTEYTYILILSSHVSSIIHIVIVDTESLILFSLVYSLDIFLIYRSCFDLLASRAFSILSYTFIFLWLLLFVHLFCRSILWHLCRILTAGVAATYSSMAFSTLLCFTPLLC